MQHYVNIIMFGFWRRQVIGNNFTPQNAGDIEHTALRGLSSQRTVMSLAKTQNNGGDSSDMWILFILIETPCALSYTSVPCWGCSSSRSSSGCLYSPRPSCSDPGHEPLTCSLHRKSPKEHKVPTLPKEPPGRPNNSNKQWRNSRRFALKMYLFFAAVTYPTWFSRVFGL